MEPRLGYLATLYGFYLVFVGVRELHATTAARAAAVVLSAEALRAALNLSQEYNLDFLLWDCCSIMPARIVRFWLLHDTVRDLRVLQPEREGTD